MPSMTGSVCLIDGIITSGVSLREVPASLFMEPVHIKRAQRRFCGGRRVKLQRAAVFQLAYAKSRSSKRMNANKIAALQYAVQ